MYNFVKKREGNDFEWYYGMSSYDFSFNLLLLVLIGDRAALKFEPHQLYRYIRGPPHFGQVDRKFVPTHYLKVFREWVI